GIEPLSQKRKPQTGGEEGGWESVWGKQGEGRRRSSLGDRVACRCGWHSPICEWLTKSYGLKMGTICHPNGLKLPYGMVNVQLKSHGDERKYQSQQGQLYNQIPLSPHESGYSEAPDIVRMRP
ncbi:hypothetical protein AVEN_28623-1, partial [Araneus ventricosus]